jgi:ATP-dependent RNA helicase DeaD
MDLEYYVHRIGRTGRAGKLGRAFLFISKRDRNRMRDLENYTKSAIPQGQIPTQADMTKARQNKFVEKIKANIQEEGNEAFEGIVDQLKEEGFLTHQIVSALMRMQSGTVRKSSFKDHELSDDGGRGAERRTESRFGGRNERPTGGRGYERGGDSQRNGSFERRGDATRSRSRFEGSESPRPRREFGSGAPTGVAEAGMTRLFLNLGRKDNVSPNHIVGAIASEAKIPGKAIGQIDMYDKFSFIEVAHKDVSRVIDGMKGKTINAREANIEVAK